MRGCDGVYVRVVMRVYAHMRGVIKMRLRFRGTDTYLNHAGIAIEFSEVVAKWLCKAFPELEIVYPHDFQI